MYFNATRPITHITSDFSGSLGSLEGNSIQLQVIARCLHLLPRRLVNFLHRKIMLKIKMLCRDIIIFFRGFLKILFASI